METWLSELRPYPGEPRASAGWRLAKSAWRLLRSGHGLALPTLALVALLAAQAIVALFAPSASAVIVAHHTHDWLLHLLVAAVTLLATNYLLVAIAAATDAAIDGLPMEGLEPFIDANAVLDPIIRWSLLSILIGLVVEIVGVGLLGAVWLVGLFVLGWSLATIVVIPTLAIERVGPGLALKESARLFRARWRETLAGIFGIAVFAGLALIPFGMLISHATALNHEGHGRDYPLAIAAFLLFAAVTAASLAVKEAFAVLLLRRDLDDLPETTFAGKRLSRKMKVLRVAGATVLVLGILGAMSGVTKHDRQINADAAAPGANFVITMPDREERPLPSGSAVVYRGRKIGVVLGTQSNHGGLRVSFHVEPGFGPSTTPGSFRIVFVGVGSPYLLFVAAATGPESQSF